MRVTTQVLDVAHGRPASGVLVRLERVRGNGMWGVVGCERTDSAGRIESWGDDRLGNGQYRLVVDASGFFATLGLASSQIEVAITFVARPQRNGYHVPVLIAPFGFMTCTSEEV
jgi:5-hydroxyisourate hydrolase